MLYGIAVFPSNEIKELANRLRRRYDTQFSFIEPHLTLRSQESWSDEQLQNVTAHLQSITAQIKPLELHFNRFSTFYPVTNVIYMALSDAGPMHALYSKVCSGILEELNKPYTYTPHLTIAQNLGDDELHDVFGSLRPRTLDLSCRIDRIELLKRSEDGVWKPFSHYPLLG